MREKLALFGGSPVRSVPYKLNGVGDEEKRLVMDVLESGLLSGFVARGNNEFYGGKYVKELEAMFCERFGSRYAATFNSATSGLHGALIATGIGPGDEVIVPPYSMSATATAVLMCHAVPVFVDIEPDMFCIEPDLIKSAITPKTKAILPVNLFGQPADIGAIMEIAEQNNLIVIEDNAQSPGASYKRRYAGTIGHMGVFSLNRHKNIQCGEGGVVLTDDRSLAERLYLSRNHGEVVLLDWEDHSNADVIGYNYRLSELHAAVAIGQLKRLDEVNDVRITLARYLTERLSEISFLTPPRIREGCAHVFYLFPMLYDKSKLGIHRDTLLKALLKEGVQSANYVAPIYMCPIYQDVKESGLHSRKRMFPEYDGSVNYSPGICQTVEELYKEKMLLTNICRPPNTKKEIDEFIEALKKIESNRDILLDYERSH